MLISLSYFLFLSKTDLFSKSFERYKYQGYSFSFDEVVTNKNPLYPEFIFKDISLQNENEEIKIIQLNLGMNLLGFFFGDLQRIKYVKIYATEINTKDYISLLPENSIALKKNLLNIVDDGNIEELYFEFINGEDISVNNEFIISELIIKTGSVRKLKATKAYVTADSNQVKIRF